MRILGADVRQFGAESGFVYPRIHLLVDTIPQACVFEQEGNVFWGVKDGLVRHFYYSGPGKGPLGEFDIELKSGDLKHVVNPWPLETEQLNTQFPLSVDVTLTDDPQAFQAGQGYEATITVEKALEALALADPQSLKASPIHFKLMCKFIPETGGVRLFPVLAKEIGGAPEVLFDAQTIVWGLEFGQQEVQKQLNDASYKLHKVLPDLRLYGTSIFESVQSALHEINLLTAMLNDEPEAFSEDPTGPPEGFPFKSSTEPIEVPFPDAPEEVSTFTPDADPDDYDAVLDELEELDEDE